MIGGRDRVKKGGKKDARVATVAPGRLHFFGYRFPSTWLKNKRRGAAPPGVGIFFRRVARANRRPQGASLRRVRVFLSDEGK